MLENTHFLSRFVSSYKKHNYICSRKKARKKDETQNNAIDSYYSYVDDDGRMCYPLWMLDNNKN